MQDHDDWYAQGVKKRDHVLSVGAAIDAVLVLHDHDIEAVEHVGCRRRTRNRARHEIMHDLAGRAQGWLVEHPYNGDLIARPGQVRD